MKFPIIAAAISSVLMMSSAFAATEGGHGVVNFTGNIVAATCELATGTDTQNVPLGDVAANAFKATGDASNAVAFSINLTNCAADAGSATVAFSGETVADDTLKSSAGDTTKVGIQILQDGNPLKVDGSAASTAKVLVEGDNSLDFAARYVALEDTVAAGAANGSANFVVSYQ